MFRFLLGCPSGKAQSKNGDRLLCAGKRQNGGRIRFPIPLPFVVANLLIFEGKGWVISQKKNRGKGTKLKFLSEVISPMLSSKK